MIILVYSHTCAQNIKAQLGLPEYSYYFVLKEFLPILRQLGTVISVTDPACEVDQIYEACHIKGKNCIFLSFTAPQNTPTDLKCPTLSVFAWEFSNLPTETWDDNLRNDWRTVFNHLGGAITHSNHAKNLVQDAMGENFQICSIPAPIWDRFDALYRKQGLLNLDQKYCLQFEGTVIDSRTFEFFDLYRRTRLHEPRPILLRNSASAQANPVSLNLSGVIYTAIFNPFDSRKNWFYLICAFCLALKDKEDATLVLKLTHFDPSETMHPMLESIKRIMPMHCRVVFVHGMLDDACYETLMQATTYAVNASTGEGQCLPLMEAMSAGKPVIAPLHTAMHDYLNPDNGFIVKHSMEPTFWPQDPRQIYRTLRARIEFDSLMQAYRDSYETATTNQTRYKKMSVHANESLHAFCSATATRTRLTEFFTTFLNHFPENTHTNSSENFTDSRTCGLTDAVQNGWFNAKTGELLTGFTIKSHHTVLDVGCGTGAATLFAEKQGARVFFSDICAKSISALAEKIPKLSTRAVFGMVANSEKLPLPDNLADRIISMEMLEHVDEPQRALAELVRVGSPGAKYLITAPDARGEYLQKQLAPISHFQKPNHIHIFSREEFTALITNAGLIIEACHQDGFFWTLWMCLFWAEAHNEYTSATMDLVTPPYPPLINHWANTWETLIHMPQGLRVKRVLDEYLPKRQIILARKPLF